MINRGAVDNRCEKCKCPGHYNPSDKRRDKFFSRRFFTATVTVPVIVRIFQYGGQLECETMGWLLPSQKFTVDAPLRAKQAFR
ncbi:hypothetical protein CEXT_122711 [Caerostris extrusa]|uniref:Uncharacterized protein n=1 Tax=Caerostris extrusa TaxID=172846 RepID=A0AAV4V034_CAEEX|nr:hypothetical protein CEXT_122711 [Caerostris extrusa]